jgi:hypothetical protein
MLPSNILKYSLSNNLDYIWWIIGFSMSQQKSKISKDEKDY